VNAIGPAGTYRHFVFFAFFAVEYPHNPNSSGSVLVPKNKNLSFDKSAPAVEGGEP
jgi:hypothetical protein